MASATDSPSWLLGLLEAPRALTEAGSLIPASAILKDLPPGDGHPVLTLPGFLATDRSTRVLRRYVYDWGYDSYRWRLGRNFGPSHKRDLDQLLEERLHKIYQETGRKVSVVGWSLGGMYAMELARRNPSIVRSVVTLGSPHGDPKQTNAWQLYEMLSGIDVDDEKLRDRIEQLRESPPNVPVTAVYSMSDAVVSWKIATLPPSAHVENIGINASHFGMGFNPVVLYLIADRLRQLEGDWSPFEISGMRNLFYHSNV